jgi:phosphoribosylformimino-5-aminoimidazole carboxamide ribotide isomerase
MFRPCIDLHSGRVKQIVGSSLRDGNDGAKPVTNFESDKPSSHYASLFQQSGMSGGHVIMLGPGNEEAAMDALRAYPGGMQVGGGITPENAQRYLDAGASHVIVTSYV